MNRIILNEDENLRREQEATKKALREAMDGRKYYHIWRALAEEVAGVINCYPGT